MEGSICEVGPALLPTPLSPACGLRDESQCFAPGVSPLFKGRNLRSSAMSPGARAGAGKRTWQVHIARIGPYRGSAFPRPDLFCHLIGYGVPWGITVSIGGKTLAWPVRAMSVCVIDSLQAVSREGVPSAFLLRTTSIVASLRFLVREVRIGRRSFPSIRCA